ETYDAHQKNVAKLRAMEKQIQNDTVEPAEEAPAPAAAPAAADTAPTATTPPKPTQQKKPPARPARQGALQLSPPVVRR
ncbi:MAG TPA: aminodeoxychorismate lyase, partial [Devosia sp.]